MTQSQETEAAFRAAFPNMASEEIPAAYERFRQYVRIATEIIAAKFSPTADASSAALTDSIESASVKAGKVDPGTFTNTG